MDAFAGSVAAFEGANLREEHTAQAYSAGMGAVSGVFWALARAGAHVVAPSALHDGTYGFLREALDTLAR